MSQVPTTDIPTTTDVLVVGGGPAGALLGLLLARQGVTVTVAEKQAELARSFRGETIAARSVLTLRQHGLEPALRSHGYLQVSGIQLWERGRRMIHVDYGSLPIGVLPIDLPQPALIGACIEAAETQPGYRYLRGTSCVGLLEDGGAVVGASLKQQGADTPTDVRARLVVGADGRTSQVRKLSGLEFDEQPLARDFLWFKVPRPPDWGTDTTLMVERDRHVVILPTFPDFLRVGVNLPKGGLRDIRGQGIEALHATVGQLAPRLRPLIEQHIQSWADTSFLDIFTVTMPQWARDGLVLVGDASQTASPVLGQGVHLAIQDVNLLAPTLAPLLAARVPRAGGPLPAADLAEFVAARQAHKKTVAKAQRIQEQSLAAHRPVAMAVRRRRLRAMDRLPIKVRLMDRILNAPHDAPAPPAPARLAEAKDFVGLHATHLGLDKGAPRVLARITSLDGDGPGSWVEEWSREAEGRVEQGDHKGAADLYNLARFPVADDDTKRQAARSAAEHCRAWLDSSGRGVAATAVVDGTEVPFLFGPPKSPDAPLVVMMGGIVSLKEQWAGFLGLARRLGAGIALVDFPGVGENPLPYSRDAAAVFGAVKQAVDGQVDTSRMFMATPSFGGHLAALWALQDPDVARIVTVGAPLRYFFLDLSRETLPQITRDALCHTTGAGPEQLKDTLAPLALTDDELSRLTCPVLYVASLRDEIIPLADWQHARDVVPDMTVYAFDDVHAAPHHLRQTRMLTMGALLEHAGRHRAARALALLTRRKLRDAARSGMRQPVPVTSSPRAVVPPVAS